MNNVELLSEALVINPQFWTKGHLEVLPKGYLLDKVSSSTLYEIWDHLPDRLKKDEELQSHLPCLKHYNDADDVMHIDGPPPPKYRCLVCRRQKEDGLFEQAR